MEKECPTCRNCGAEIKMEEGMKECPTCHMDINKCIVKDDVTSSVYPQ